MKGSAGIPALDLKVGSLASVYSRTEDTPSRPFDPTDFTYTVTGAENHSFE